MGFSVLNDIYILLITNDLWGGCFACFVITLRRACYELAGVTGLGSRGSVVQIHSPRLSLTPSIPDTYIAQIPMTFFIFISSFRIGDNHTCLSYKNRVLKSGKAYKKNTQKIFENEFDKKLSLVLSEMPFYLTINRIMTACGNSYYIICQFASSRKTWADYCFLQE